MNSTPISAIPDDASDSPIISWIASRGASPHFQYIACFRYPSGAYREFDGHTWKVWPNGKEG